MRVNFGPVAADALFVLAGFGVLNAIGILRSSLWDFLAAVGLAFLAGVSFVSTSAIVLLTIGDFPPAAHIHRALAGDGRWSGCSLGADGSGCFVSGVPAIGELDPSSAERASHRWIATVTLARVCSLRGRGFVLRARTRADRSGTRGRSGRGRARCSSIGVAPEGLLHFIGIRVHARRLPPPDPGVRVDPLPGDGHDRYPGYSLAVLAAAGRVYLGAALPGPPPRDVLRVAADRGGGLDRAGRPRPAPHRLCGYPDGIFLALGALLLGEWLAARDSRMLALAMLMLVGSANTKNEGSMVAACARGRRPVDGARASPV